MSVGHITSILQQTFNFFVALAFRTHVLRWEWKTTKKQTLT